jgi:hypothetical protein
VLGNTSDAAGTSKTSSKVSASRISIPVLHGYLVWHVPIAWITLRRKGHSGRVWRDDRVSPVREGRDVPDDVMFAVAFHAFWHDGTGNLQ